MIEVFIDRQVMQSVMSGVADQLKSKIDLDLNHVKKLCKERYGIETINGVEHKGGNMAVFNGQIACELDFEVRFPMSVLIRTKEDINDSIPEKNAVRAEELDDIPVELDDLETDKLEEMLADELDDIPEELDGLEPDEIDDIPEEIDDLELDEVDDMLDRLEDKPQIDKDNKKP
jgi:hypothetical protein